MLLREAMRARGRDCVRRPRGRARSQERFDFVASPRSRAHEFTLAFTKSPLHRAATVFMKVAVPFSASSPTGAMRFSTFAMVVEVPDASNPERETPMCPALLEPFVLRHALAVTSSAAKAGAIVSAGTARRHGG